MKKVDLIEVGFEDFELNIDTSGVDQVIQEGKNVIARKAAETKKLYIKFGRYTKEITEEQYLTFFKEHRGREQDYMLEMLNKIHNGINKD